MNQNRKPVLPQAVELSGTMTNEQRTLLASLLALASNDAIARELVASARDNNKKIEENQRKIAICGSARLDYMHEASALSERAARLGNFISEIEAVIARLQAGEEDVTLPAYVNGKQPRAPRAAKGGSTLASASVDHTGKRCDDGYVIREDDDYKNAFWKHSYAFLCRPALRAAGFKNLMEWEKAAPDAAAAAKAAIPMWEPKN